jgi:nickel/cobalt exporter
MHSELTPLVISAASIGAIHTLLGPDHYIPFVALAKARNWTTARMAIVTALCGIGHVLGSVVLGLIGVAAGTAVFHLETIESVRGDLAAWALIAFGLVYTAWGLRRAGRKHAHPHVGNAGPATEHVKRPGSVWAMFIIFVLGPCEPLIPLLIYPAANSSWYGVGMVVLVFGTTTIATMVASATVLKLGMNRLPFGRLERYSHALAGAAITVCGISIHFGL